MTDTVLLFDAARAGHILGLAAGFGLALLADFVAVRAIVQPIGPRDVWTLRWLHRIILGGLALLWVSGLYLLWVRTGFEAGNFSPKLVTKLVIVGLLTMNALTIGGYALPRYAANLGRRFGEFPLHERLRLALVAGLSMSCWVSALVLGVFSQLKPMGFEGLQAIFAPVFLAGLAGALAFGLGASLFAGRGRDWGDTGVGRVPSRMLGM